LLLLIDSMYENNRSQNCNLTLSRFFVYGRRKVDLPNKSISSRCGMMTICLSLADVAAPVLGLR
jgi:hypothetical protein